MAPRVLVIDNYDSFVYNLVQYLGELGAEPVVVRNDELDLDGLIALSPDLLLVSPVPDALRMPASRRSRSSTSALTMCQSSASAWVISASARSLAGVVVSAPEIMHGKTSMIHHQSTGVFSGLENPFEATRYHSLVVRRGVGPRRARGHGADLGRCGDGPSSPFAPDRGCSVPPGIHSHHRRPSPARELPCQGPSEDSLAR